MKLVFVVLLATAFCGLPFAQTKKTGEAKAGGPCSPAVTGDNNTFTFTYCGSDPKEKNKILKLLQAISEGKDVTNAKLDEVLEILSRPIKLITTKVESIPAAQNGHPRTAITFYTEDPVERGQFEILCDRSCTPVDISLLEGSNASLLATVSDHPDVAEFLFQRQVPALRECTLTVESRDDKAVKIKQLATSRRTANLVWNPDQPKPRVVAGNSVIAR